MLENRLARNSPCPVLHEIVLAEPLKYFRVVTERDTEMRLLCIKMFLMLFAKSTKEQKV